MKLICPEHGGTIEVVGAHISNEKDFLIENLVAECPVCGDEVIINGVFDYDENGIPCQKSSCLET